MGCEFMSELYLTSSVHAVAHHIGKRLDLSVRNKLVFITTPAEPEKGDTGWLADDRQSLVRAGFAVTDYTITHKSKEELRHDLDEYDYIYVSGGNTFYLLRQAEQSGFDELVKEWVNERGKIYIGTSAGSIITGKKCPDYLLSGKEYFQTEHRDGFGFVNFTVVPHWGSEGFKDLYLQKRLKIAYREDQVPLLVLTDYQYVHVFNGRFEVVDVRDESGGE